jgi:hypothetical protein
MNIIPGWDILASGVFVGFVKILLGLRVLSETMAT